MVRAISTWLICVLAAASLAACNGGQKKAGISRTLNKESAQEKRRKALDNRSEKSKELDKLTDFDCPDISRIAKKLVSDPEAYTVYISDMDLGALEPNPGAGSGYVFRSNAEEALRGAHAFKDSEIKPQIRTWRASDLMRSPAGPFLRVMEQIRCERVRFEGAGDFEVVHKNERMLTIKQSSAGNEDIITYFLSNNELVISVFEGTQGPASCTDKAPTKRFVKTTYVVNYGPADRVQLRRPFALLMSKYLTPKIPALENLLKMTEGAKEDPNAKGVFADNVNIDFGSYAFAAQLITDQSFDNLKCGN